LRAAPGLALALGFALASCAAIIDVKELRPPDAASDDAGPDAGAAANGDACGAPGVTNLTVTPRGLHTALDATDVYFTRGDPPFDSAILKCSKCGCAKPTELVSNLELPAAIAVDDTYVYWTDSLEGSLNRIAKADPTKPQSMKSLDQPIGVAVDDTSVYWTEIGSTAGSLARAGIWRATKTDFGSPTRLTAAATLPDNLFPYAVAVDTTDVYFTTAPDIDDQSPDMPCMAANGTIRRVAKRGNADQLSVKLATGQACPIGLALSDDALYWVNLGAGTGLAGSVYTRPKSGNAATKLADNQGRPTSIAFYGGRIAWSSPAQQSLLTCTAPACTDTAPLARTQANPSGVSADDSGFYWVDLGTIAASFGDGALRHAPPP
jgi:hypothetical protein